MHHKLPRHLFIVAFLSVAVMGGLAYHFRDRTPTKLTPTVTVSSNQSIGGTQPSQPSNPHENTTTSSQNTPKTIQSKQSVMPTPEAKPSAPVTPKQTTIARSIITEYPYRALGVTSNDPYLTRSLATQKTSLTNAWSTSTGASTVVVADIDTGFALQHEDLQSQWYQNSGETGATKLGDRCWTGTPQDKSANNCDDDGNGYTDDWRGWNFYGTLDKVSGNYIQNNNPQAGLTNSAGQALSHGTETAGLLGAATNNGIGIASANWQTKVMPLQALDDNGNGTTSGIVYAIYYAVDNGAQIINMSLGGSVNDLAVQKAVDYAFSKNVLIVAAAGNCGAGKEAGCDPNAPGAMSYPALGNHVLAVGATDQYDTRTSFSSYGPGLDVMAPGSGAIISTMVDQSTTPANYTNAYSATLYGTSFSTPITSGIASLIKSLRPTSTPDEITAIIDGSARKVSGMNGALYTPLYGHGVITADTAAKIEQAFATNNSTVAPTLAQTGNYQSEHSFDQTSLMSSGCKVAANTYCTIRLNDQTNGYDRYLPYVLANTSGQAGWSWPGSTMTSGEWNVTAVSGNQSSGFYPLFSK